MPSKNGLLQALRDTVLEDVDGDFYAFKMVNGQYALRCGSGAPTGTADAKMYINLTATGAGTTYYYNVNGTWTAGYVPGSSLDFGVGPIKVDGLSESTSSGGISLNHNTTVASGKTIAVTTADKLTLGGVIAPDTLELSILVGPHASLTARNLWVARRACIVTACGWVNNLVQGGALTATLVKATGTSAPAKASTPLHTADQIDLNGVAAHTVQTLTAAAAGNRTLAAGDRLGIDHGAMTTAVGVATFSIQYV